MLEERRTEEEEEARHRFSIPLIFSRALTREHYQPLRGSMRVWTFYVYKPLNQWSVLSNRSWFFFVELQTNKQRTKIKNFPRVRLIIARNRCWTNYRESHARNFCGILCKTWWPKKRVSGNWKRDEKNMKKAKEKTVQRSRSHSSQIFFRKLSLVSTPLQIPLRSGWMRSFCSLDFRTSFLFSYLSVFH